MSSGTKARRAVSRMLTMLLSLALFISMMPFGMGIVFASSPEDFQPVLTITGPDGNVTEYQTVQDVITGIGELNEPDTSFVAAGLRGIAIKKLLSGYDDNCVVTVKTQDNYDGTLNANGKTVAELKSLKGLLAYQEGDTPYDPTVEGTKDKGYFKLYVGKDGDKVMVDKWVNRITISNPSEDQGDPEPEPDVLTLKGDSLKKPLIFDTIKTLKNDESIKPLILKDVVFHTANSYGTEANYKVTGVTIESLIRLAGLKDGVELESVTASADDGYSKTYTAKQILEKDLQGNKAMFIWSEQKEGGSEEKVQKTAVGQFAAGEANRGLWVGGKAVTLTVKTKVVPPAPTTPPDKPVIKVKAGKKKATISWKKVNGAAGYEVYRSTKKKKGFKKVKTIANGNTVKFVNKKLKGGKTYYYKVRAYKKASDGKNVYGNFSAVKKVKTKK